MKEARNLREMNFNSDFSTQHSRRMGNANSARKADLEDIHSTDRS
jgi:hypothetical protein